MKISTLFPNGIPFLLGGGEIVVRGEFHYLRLVVGCQLLLFSFQLPTSSRSSESGKLHKMQTCDMLKVRVAGV
jgi:hypothetical protein